MITDYIPDLELPDAPGERPHTLEIAYQDRNNDVFHDLRYLRYRAHTETFAQATPQRAVGNLLVHRFASDQDLDTSLYLRETDDAPALSVRIMQVTAGKNGAEKDGFYVSIDRGSYAASQRDDGTTTWLEGFFYVDGTFVPHEDRKGQIMTGTGQWVPEEHMIDHKYREIDRRLSEIEAREADKIIERLEQEG
jgi:hypothetical protein